MAELAAGAGVALAAEQIISTTVYAGAAGYAVGKSTMPLKATYTMIAHATDDSSKRSLARRNHTVTVIGNKAYIFGGDVRPDEGDSSDWKVASNDMHVVTLSPSGKPESDYQLIPAIPSVENGPVPIPRTSHSACAFDGCVAIYGEQSAWTQLEAKNPESKIDAKWKDIEVDGKPVPVAGPRERSNAKLFAHEAKFTLYGGMDTNGTQMKDVWQFDVESKVWSKISEAPVSTSSAAFADGCLYLISSLDQMRSQLHHIDLASSKDGETVWGSVSFPTNPMAPGPRPRENGGLFPITTGYGRNFLVYFLGSREKPSSHDEAGGITQWSDMWTLQLPSSDLSAKPKMSLTEAIKPAKIKDAIRSALPGTESGLFTWAEVEVQVPAPDQMNGEGKLHPGPRSLFGCDVMQNRSSVVIWGGEDAKGERVGDGWIVRLE